MWGAGLKGPGAGEERAEGSLEEEVPGACRPLGPEAEPHWCDMAWTPRPRGTEGHLPRQSCCLMVGSPRGHGAENSRE